MRSIQSVIQKTINTYQDKQGCKRKKIDIEAFEKEIIETIGSQEKYISLGGYKEFYECIQFLRNSEIIKPLSSCKENNSKKPILIKSWWLEAKFSCDQWDSNLIAKLSTLLDITFFIRNKKYQTPEQLEKIECLYRFLKRPPSNIILIREERSLDIFSDISAHLNFESEKYLSTSEGKTLLNRLNLTSKDLKFEPVREPFDFWINDKISDENKFEILIVEGLATYHTLKKILQKDFQWKLGPKPYLLIWGAGRRIEGTIDYIYDIIPNPEKMVIRYAGDIDSEGLDIYHNLKKKNSYLKIVLATPFYEFLIAYKLEHAKKISTNQRKVDAILKDIKTSFQEQQNTYSKIEHLWFNKMRIPLEFINFETLMKEGWLYNA